MKNMIFTILEMQRHTPRHDNSTRGYWMWIGVVTKMLHRCVCKYALSSAILNWYQLFGNLVTQHHVRTRLTSKVLLLSNLTPRMSRLGLDGMRILEKTRSPRSTGRVHSSGTARRKPRTVEYSYRGHIKHQPQPIDHGRNSTMPPTSIDHRLKMRSHWQKHQNLNWPQAERHKTSHAWLTLKEFLEVLR